VIAPAERSRELAIEKVGHIRFHGAGSDRIIRDQPCHRCFDECRFDGRKVHVSGTGGARRSIGGAFFPRHGAANGLRGRSELSIVHGRRRRSRDACCDAADEKLPAPEIYFGHHKSLLTAVLRIPDIGYY
jgi:hypothetical protein